ncbi:UNC93-like protein [Lachnellula occidentalis]|uniref:UNC93-like protein n=1 Tax=Lachnellula occidentalis TaxID=215460 RepID=A0A8H8U712_9HELO|nr:UNC93-like protein [Lachnellula occidentalis]
MASSEDRPLQKRLWYRTTLFNAFVIGGVGFLAPGLWNAMSSLGAGGAQSPFLVNAANSLVFGGISVLARWADLKQNWPELDSLSWCGRISGLFGNNWLVLVGAVFCGISAGLFWASEGAVALGYPEASKRGKYMKYARTVQSHISSITDWLYDDSIWLIFRTGGPLVGGAIVLALNHGAQQKKKGKVGYETYLVFIALQCIAAPVALLLTPPEKVQRSDGTKVKIVAEKSFVAEIKALGRALARRDILLLLPIFWAAYFNQYSSNFQTYYFGVRARALSGFVINFAALLSSYLISLLLDYKKFPVKKRLNIGFYWVIFWHLVAWIYAWVIQEKYTRHPPAWDWEDSGFVEGFFVLAFWQFSQQSLQNWLYYFVSTKTDNISELSRFTGILRGQESFSQAVSYGLNTREWKGGRVPLAVNTILLGLAVVPTWIAMREHAPVESDKSYGFEGQSDEEIPSEEILTTQTSKVVAVQSTAHR